jgi:hypothetical protein
VDVDHREPVTAGQVGVAELTGVRDGDGRQVRRAAHEQRQVEHGAGGQRIGGLECRQGCVVR